MTGQGAFLARLITILEARGIGFMLCGSIASSFHGRPRATRDVDLVIDCSLEQLSGFLVDVHEAGWYVDDRAARAAVSNRSMFNVIDSSAGWKADLIVLQARPFSAEEFQRRVTAHVLGRDAPAAAVATAEDTILSKLEWARHSGSEQQYRDAAEVAALRARELDRTYLTRWAAELGVLDELKRVLAEADAAS